MNKLVSIVLVGMGLLSFTTCQKLADPEKIKMGAKQLDDKWVTAFVNMDIKGIMDCYWNSPGVTFYPPDTMEIRGYEAIRTWYQVFFVLNRIKEAKLVNASYFALGDNALRLGQWLVTAETPRGQNIVKQLGQTVVSSLRDGKWVYIHDHISEPLPETQVKPEKSN